MKVPQWLGYEPIPGRGQVKRCGIILVATEDHDTPEDRKERLFETGRQPRRMNQISYEF